MICLNLIVKNEAPRIERALRSALGVVGHLAILDTGSTDNTMDLIARWAEANDMGLTIDSSPFKDFSSSRNEALALAKSAMAAYAGDDPHWILLMDADMELRDPEANWHLAAPVYRILQRHAGGMSYWNTRLIRADVDAAYLGVTHEYLSIPDGAGPPQPLEGPWFFDHSDGGNRPGKFQRDIGLLRAEVLRDPNDARSMFYLAQSYRDEGDHESARNCYRERAGMLGTWEEERWRAQLEFGRLGDDDELLRAFSQRPSRAEPLHDLALRYNERGHHPLATMVASWGMTIPLPVGDILFREDSTYEYGLRQEFSIAANYHPDPAVKAMGRMICDRLSLDRGVPDGTRWLAFANYHWYMETAAQMFPSFRKWRVGYRAPAGWRHMAPSICQGPAGPNGRPTYLMTLRTVNYVTMPNGSHDFVPPVGQPISTRNWLLTLDAALDITEGWEIHLPEDWPPIQYREVRGMEDLRLTYANGRPQIVGNAREIDPQGWCQQIEAEIHGSRMANWAIISKVPPERHEKNWMPITGAGEYIYLCDPLIRITRDGYPLLAPPGKIHAERFRGSSQVISWRGRWLCIIHEVEWRDSLSHYRSRFVEFDDSLFAIRRVSRPFYFHHHGIEIATGLAPGPNPDQLVVSFSWMDREAWLATLDDRDVDNALGDPL